MNWRQVGITLIAVVAIAGGFYVIGTFIRGGSGGGLSDVACTDGQIIVYDAPASLWKCADPPGDTLPAICDDGAIAVFDTGSGSWTCGARGHVLVAANDAVIGPVVGYDLHSVLVAATLSDANGTPHRFLLASTGAYFKRQESRLFFPQPGCSGDAFVSASEFVGNSRQILHLSPDFAPVVFTHSLDRTNQRLYLVDVSAEVTPDVVSVEYAGQQCDAFDPATSPQTAPYHPATLLSADLGTPYPAPHRLEPR